MQMLINGNLFEAPKEVMTGAEIKKVAGVSSVDQLCLFEPPDYPEIADDQEVKLFERIVFRTHGPDGVSA